MPAHKVILLSAFLSCSFQIATYRGQHAMPPVNPSPDPASISEALSLSEKNMKTKTGIYTLENGGKSLLARLWFFDHAKKTIDLQYYSFAKDVTGLVASDHIVRAADKGVKVRILVDDAATKMYSHEVQMLDAHKNIEVKVYNAGLLLGRLDRRLGKLSKNYNRLLRRMHNKTVTVDEEVGIMGGRNIADEYFDFDHRYNFRDRDVILLGKAVAEVKSSFEKFWNDSLTVAYAELSGKRKNLNADEYYEALHKDAADTTKFSSGMRDRIEAFAEELKAAEKSGELVWVENAIFISDKPGKNEDRAKREGGICCDSIKALIRQAKKSIIIQSPYFITTGESKQLLRETVQRGIKIRLLTNSLASTDNFEAFSGYQRDREMLLKTGLQMYEFKPDSKVRYKLMIPEVQEGLDYKSVYGFHSKTIIIDGYITVIGSYNFDPRSANYNTECISIIRSAEVAKNLAKYIEEEFLPENAWQISTDYNPDHKAKIRKRMKAFSRRIIPKKVL